ncbi:MAG: hypothetical protein HY788_21980 [Deltaproteobacteria bacterium]|nr:hypothetical protein [Deltaproteobacteria bacterium]
MGRVRRKITRMFFVVLCITGVAALAQGADYKGIWQDDSPTPSHNFYIQHYEQGQSTVVVYTRDANTYYSFLSNISNSVFDAPSLDPGNALSLHVTFTSQTIGAASITDHTAVPPSTTNINIKRAFEARVTDRSGIWKDAGNTFSMYVQDYVTNSTIIVYTFDAKAFEAFQSTISGNTFSSVNLGDGAEQMSTEFASSTTGTVNVSPVSAGALGPQANSFSFNVMKAFFPTPPSTYVGSATCSQCHSAKHASFLHTGHPYKISKVADATQPTFPFTDITGVLEGISDDLDGTPATDNSLGKPESYADVSYVIGGFGWKVRFLDADGYRVTGDAVQYNFGDASYSSYENGSVDLTFNCGNCHTTGWRHYDQVSNPNRQDGLPGMDGAFEFTGIQCESCHGAGSKHVTTNGDKSQITRVAQPRTTDDFAVDMGYGKPVACSECHTRDGEKDYPAYKSPYENAAGLTDSPGGRIQAGGGLISHHEQYDELVGINPNNAAAGSTRGPGFKSAKLTCIGCHEPHATTLYQETSGDDPGVALDCTACHSDKTITSGGMTALECVDCHMPYLVKSAIETFQNGTDAPDLGDIRTHILKIDLTTTDQFTPDGAFAYPWITGEFACKRCHSDDGPNFPISFPSEIAIHN